MVFGRWYASKKNTSKILVMIFYDVNPTLIATLVQRGFFSVEHRVNRTEKIGLFERSNRDITCAGKKKFFLQKFFFFWKRWILFKKNSYMNSFLNEFYDVNPTLIQLWYNVAPRHRTNVGLTLQNIITRRFEVFGRWRILKKKYQKFSMS